MINIEYNFAGCIASISRTHVSSKSRTQQDSNHQNNPKQFHVVSTSRVQIIHGRISYDSNQVDRSPPASAEITEEWGGWRFVVSAVAVMESVKKKEWFIQLRTLYLWITLILLFVCFFWQEERDERLHWLAHSELEMSPVEDTLRLLASKGATGVANISQGTLDDLGVSTDDSNVFGTSSWIRGSTPCHYILAYINGSTPDMTMWVIM